MKSLFKTFMSISIFAFMLFAEATPLVISHRGGGQNFPENTELAFTQSLEMGCDAVELDVQITKDGVLVIYHPDDLKKLTNGSGPIEQHTWEEISGLNAAYHFKPEKGYPFRDLNLKIPKLTDILHLFPKTLFIIDMKSLPAETLVEALVQTITDEDASRLIFYSTNTEHIDRLNHKKPYWNTFETRDATRQKLFDWNQRKNSEYPPSANWIGYELNRTMQVTETFTLGKGTSIVDFHLWNAEIVSRLKRENPQVFLVLFGINNEEEWKAACNLGVDAIYSDNPEEIIKIKINSGNYTIREK